MTSKRQQILDAIGAQLPLINTAFGYCNSVPVGRIYRGYKSKNEVNEYPVVYYGLGSETMEGISEGDTILRMELEAYIGVWMQTNSGQGNITNEMEGWIRDIKRFIQGDKQVDKKFDLSEIKGVLNANIGRISPYLDYEENTGVLLIEFKIEYLESTIEGI